MTDASAAPVAVDGAARYELLARCVRVEKGRRAFEAPLDDPADTAFLRLPSLDLSDGRPLRRAAFDVWAANVRAVVEAGREFETTFHPRKPLVTALAIAGASFVSATCALVLWTWAFRPDRPVTVQPTTAEAFLIVVAVALVASLIALSLSALVRTWRCRDGSYVHVAWLGMRTSKGGRAEPLASIAAADWHPFVRCTRIAFVDGRPDLWVPAESGATRRIDLLLAALDERLGAELRRRL